MNMMKKVLTFGVFDYFHYGHLKLFERCKQYGDYLVVAVQRGEEILKTKPNAQVLYTTEQRKEIVAAIKYVDCVVEYRHVEEDIEKIEFDVFIVGGDQNHSGFAQAIKWCEEHGKQVVRLERTPNICSTDIKKAVT